MTAWVGTSGWAYKEWKGSFYPENLPDDDMLSHYGQRLTSVEVNNTFYRMPRAEVVRGWAQQVPEGFRFVLKASRRITHQAKLGPAAADPLRYMLETAGELDAKLGAFLFQTPPWLKKDAGLLRDFVALVPDGVRGAFEFRSTSWFDDEVLGILADRNQALAAADTGDPDGDPPLERTADWGYARLRRAEYGDGDLEDWARRLAEQAWTDYFVFFKHEDEGAGPALARRFTDLTGIAT
jgi:uncharacterized protein YecE (DUF72 family)